MKNPSKSIIIAVCLLIGWVVTSNASLRLPLCCTGTVELCRASHQAVVNQFNCIDPCVPSHHPAGARKDHQIPSVKDLDMHPGGVACCAATACSGEGPTVFVLPSKTAPPMLMAVCTIFDLSGADSHYTTTAAITAPLSTAFPIYLQKNAFLC